MYSKYDYIPPTIDSWIIEDKFVRLKKQFESSRVNKSNSLNSPNETLMYQFAELSLQIEAVSKEKESLEQKKREIEIEIIDLRARQKSLDFCLAKNKRVPIYVKILFLVIIVGLLIAVWYPFLSKLPSYLNIFILVVITSLLFFFENTASELAHKVQFTREKERKRSAIKKARIKFFIFTIFSTILLTFTSFYAEFMKTNIQEKDFKNENLFLPICILLMCIIWFTVCHHFATKNHYKSASYNLNQTIGISSTHIENPDVTLFRISEGLKIINDDLSNLNNDISQRDRWLQKNKQMVNRMKEEINNYPN
ncbi:MAG: hypothetical protein QNJ63_14750 [Calothrix sp. MO_192.B10]|nr:hypothetical protein [Calothrix sp. MO_192.B10]